MTLKLLNYGINNNPIKWHLIWKFKTKKLFKIKKKESILLLFWLFGYVSQQTKNPTNIRNRFYSIIGSFNYSFF